MRPPPIYWRRADAQPLRANRENGDGVRDDDGLLTMQVMNFVVDSGGLEAPYIYHGRFEARLHALGGRTIATAEEGGCDRRLLRAAFMKRKMHSTEGEPGECRCRIVRKIAITVLAITLTTLAGTASAQTGAGKNANAAEKRNCLNITPDHPIGGSPPPPFSVPSYCRRVCAEVHKVYDPSAKFDPPSCMCCDPSSSTGGRR